MRRPGAWQSAILAAGVAGTALALWLGSLPGALAGVFVVGLVFASWRSAARRASGQREEARLITSAWEAARRLPRGSTYTDPVTGCGIGIDRERGFLTVSLVDAPEGGDSAGSRLVRTYLLGFLGRPVSPPLYRRTVPLSDENPRLPLRQARELVDFGLRTGADDADPAEIRELLSILERAVAAGQLEA